MGRAGSISKGSSFSGDAAERLASGSEMGSPPWRGSDGVGAMNREGGGTSLSLSVGACEVACLAPGSERGGRAEDRGAKKSCGSACSGSALSSGAGRSVNLP